jgi:anti-repressor protein
VFGYEGKEIRTTFENGEVWVAAKDVAEVLGYAKSSSIAQLMGNVPEEWKGIKRIDTPGGIQDMLCLSEQGLYFFLARSDKPKALPFQKWIAGEVLPSIRKHGLYATPATLETMLSDPDTMISVLQKLKDEQTRRRELEAKVIEDYPKVVFHDTIQAIDSEGILVKDMAALLTNAGYKTGTHRLFAWLREQGYLCKNAGYWNKPKQWAIDAGFFVCREGFYICANGETHTSVTPLVTPKGQKHIIAAFTQSQ